MRKRKDNKKQRRSHYRIIYPVAFRPVLNILNKKCAVIDISEMGIKFLCQRMSWVKPGFAVFASITFHDGKSYNLEGKIVRIEDSRAAMYITEGIPLRKIIEEQRYLISVYK